MCQDWKMKSSAVGKPSCMVVVQQRQGTGDRNAKKMRKKSKKNPYYINWE
jgi:hypothetical protein